MKPISVHVPEDAYAELKALAERDGRPVAALIREAMRDYLRREEARSAHSILQIPAHPSGAQLGDWERHEVFDALIDRGHRA